MKIIIILILFMILVIFSIYLSIIIKIKINLSCSEAVIKTNIKVFGLDKSLKIKLNYIDTIERIVNRHIDYINNDKRKYQKNKISVLRKIGRYSLHKPFFIKNISFYSECIEDRLTIAIEFSIVNILLKRGILSE